MSGLTVHPDGGVKPEEPVTHVGYIPWPLLETLSFPQLVLPSVYTVFI